MSIIEERPPGIRAGSQADTRYPRRHVRINSNRSGRADQAVRGEREDEGDRDALAHARAVDLDAAAHLFDGVGAVVQPETAEALLGRESLSEDLGQMIGLGSGWKPMPLSMIIVGVAEELFYPRLTKSKGMNVWRSNANFYL